MLDGKIVAGIFARSTMPGWPPITNRRHLKHLLLAVNPFQAVMDHLPDAVNL